MTFKLFDKPINERNLAFVDTEMTGLELMDKELLEIGVVLVKANTFEVIDEIDIKVFPTHIETASQEALGIVGYSEEEWAKEAVPLKEGIETFLDFVKDSMLVGHNLPFDWMMLQKAIEECGLEPTYFYKGLDTFTLAWLLLGENPDFPRLSVKELANHYLINLGQQHRAIDDARSTYQIFMKLMDQEKWQG